MTLENLTYKLLSSYYATFWVPSIMAFISINHPLLHLLLILMLIGVGAQINTRRSTSGHCVFLGDNIISWSSKRQAMLTRSSAETEYRGAANMVVETCWLCNLLLKLHSPLDRVTVVYCDNVSVVYLSSNLVQH